LSSRLFFPNPEDNSLLGNELTHNPSGSFSRHKNPDFCRESRFLLGLQWFAAEDEGRTEDPTETKIKKAREEGKVAKSQELTAALVLLFPIITLAILGPGMLETFVEMLTYFLRQTTDPNWLSSGTLVPSFFNYFIRLAIPVIIVAFVSSFLANIFQVGWSPSAKPIKPDFTKILPKFGKFIKKAFFSGEAYFNLGKSILKILIVGLMAFWTISDRVGQFISLSSRNVPMGLEFIATTAITLVIQVAVALLVLALPDYLFERHKHKESLKMTKQEVKEERKQQDGDPLIKSRLRERMRQILNQNMLQNVPKADVVITNPTHYAIGLGWDNEVMNAPTVLAKGQDHMALKIREIAQENQVPMVENKPLARALYSSVEVGDEVPEEYWRIVSSILAEIYRMNGKLRTAG
jgi:flagellar biosynthetic protein FlhB